MALPTATKANRPVTGALWMLVTGVLFVCVTAAVKHGARDLPAPEAAFLRFAFGIFLTLPGILAVTRHHMNRDMGLLFAARGVVHAFAVMLWFFAMTRITVAEVTAMNYLNPIFVTLGAALIFGERFARRRQVAIAVAFLGALVILRPGFREIDAGHVAMLGTALGLGASYLIAKALADRAPAGEVVGMMSLAVTIFLLPVAIAVWRTPTIIELAWMFLVAVLASLGHYTMTRAFASAPVTVTQPISFLQLIWATAIGFLLFGEAIDPYVIAGGLMILGAAAFITIREAMLARGPAERPR